MAMGKYSCCICGKELGIFSTKIVVKDGAVCMNCLKESGMETLTSPETISISALSSTIKSRIDLVRNFHPTKDYGLISIDANNQSFRIQGMIYSYENLVSYKLHEDTKHSSQRSKNNISNGAAIGGVIGGLTSGFITGTDIQSKNGQTRKSAFGELKDGLVGAIGASVGGTVGAAVGGAVGSLFTGYCHFMNISITLKDTINSDVCLHFITEKTRISSEEYINAYEEAQRCLEGLQVISQQVKKSKDERQSSQKHQLTKSVFIQKEHMSAEEIANELMIYQNLLHSGVLTQEEFDLKKKQLLSLM